MITSKSIREKKKRVYQYRKKHKLCIQCGSKKLATNSLCEIHKKRKSEKASSYYRKKNPEVKRRKVIENQHPFLTEEQLEMVKKLNINELRL